MCISPVTIKQKGTAYEDAKTIGVPCGKCYQCRERRSDMWAFRLFQERKQHTHAYFVTLTYEDSNLLWAGDQPTLYKPHLQQFFKRVRKNTKKRLKYYACGEYGEETQRPHYHALMFGVTDSEIQDNWRDGHTQFGDVNICSIKYVTQYLCKTQPKNLGDRQPDFALMSKGLGSGYLTPQMKAWHEEKMRAYVIMPGGQKRGLPRYYKEKIFDEQQRREIAQQHASQHEIQRAESVEYFSSEYEREYALLVNTKAAIDRAAYKQKQRSSL